LTVKSITVCLYKRKKKVKNSQDLLVFSIFALLENEKFPINDLNSMPVTQQKNLTLNFFLKDIEKKRNNFCCVQCQRGLNDQVV